MEIPKRASLVGFEEGVYVTYSWNDVDYSISVLREGLMLETCDMEGCSFPIDKGYDSHVLHIGKLSFKYDELLTFGDTLVFQDVNIYSVIFDLEYRYDLVREQVIISFCIGDATNVKPERGLLNALMKQDKEYSPETIIHPIHGEIPKMSPRNLQGGEKYFRSYLSYDALPIEEVKQVIGACSYYSYKEGIKLFGEYHINVKKLNYDINDTLIIPNFFRTTLTGNDILLLEKREHDVNPVEFPMNSGITATEHILRDTDVDVRKMDIRYELDIDKTDWFDAYQYILLRAANKGELAEKRLRNRKIIVTGDVIEKSQQAIDKYLKAHYTEFLETEQYKMLSLSLAQSLSLSQHKDPFKTVVFDADTCMENPIVLLEELNKIIDLFSPLIDIHILDFILNRRHDNKNIVVYTGNIHTQRYVHILDSLGYELEFSKENSTNLVSVR